MIITSDALEEYKGELDLLLAEDLELKETEETVTKRRTEIKDRVKAVGLVVGGTDERCVMVVGERGAWDRRVSMKGEGVNLATLETVLGTAKFRSLICNKITTYEPSSDKLEIARRAGKLPEAQLAQAYQAGEPMYSLFRMTPKQVAKAIDEEGL